MRAGRRPGLRWLAGLGLACAACASPADPAWVKRLGYGADQLHALELSENGLPLVRVHVEGERADLVLDTGNMSGLTLGPALSHSLGLPTVREVADRDSGGNVIARIPVYDVSSLEVFGKTFEALEAPQHGEDAFHGPRVGQGLLGPRFFAERRLTFDYGTGILAVADGPLEPGSEDLLLPLVPIPRFAGMPVVHAEVAGRRVLAQLDTGKSRTVVDPRLVEALDLPEAPRGHRLEALRLGSRELTVPSAKAVDLSGHSAGLAEPILLGIGSDLLSQVLWTLDLAAGRVILHPR